MMLNIVSSSVSTNQHIKKGHSVPERC